MTWSIGVVLWRVPSAGEMVFGFDDSDITIEGVPHTIIAGIGVKDPEVVELGLKDVKQRLSIPVEKEVKWNGMDLDQKDRESLSNELLHLLNNSAMLVTVSEGLNRQVAAELAARQSADYLASHEYQLKESPRVSLIFDEGIISKPTRYSAFLKRDLRPPLSEADFESVKSHSSSLVQLADALAGFNRLLTGIVLGRPNKTIAVWDGVLDRPVEMGLDHYISVSQRWHIWGEVPPPPDPENITFDRRWPFKHVGGFGFRIHSSISPDVIERIYDSRVVYMGCMH